MSTKLISQKVMGRLVVDRQVNGKVKREQKCGAGTEERCAVSSMQ